MKIEIDTIIDYDQNSVSELEIKLNNNFKEFGFINRKGDFLQFKDKVWLIEDIVFDFNREVIKFYFFIK